MLQVSALTAVLLAGAPLDPGIPFEKYTLPNGLTVILSEDHRIPQVAVDLWYHVGTAGDLTQEEVARAKESIVRSIPPLFETNDAVTAAIASRVEFGVPVDDYATLPARIEAVTTEAMVQAVRRYITPDSWPVIVVGPRDGVLEPLRKLGLGPVEEVPAK